MAGCCDPRGCDQLSATWPAVSDGVADDAGWPLYLARFAALLDSGD